MSEDNATTSTTASVDTTMRLNALRAADSVSGTAIKRTSESDVGDDKRHRRPRYSDDTTSLSTPTVASFSSAIASSTNRRGIISGDNDDVSSLSPSSASSSRGDCAGGIAAASLSQRLYRHALESIFSFLDLNEVVAVLRVCRDWRAAVTSMACLQFVIKNVTSLSRLSVSDVSRHVVKIGHCDSMDLDAVAVSSNFPRLHTLACTLHPGFSVTCFPPTLTDLSIYFDVIEDEQSDDEEPEDEKSAEGETSNDGRSNGWQCSVDAIGHLQMLKVCYIDWSNSPTDISFGCLSSCRSLRSLQIVWNEENEDELEQSQLDELRSMPHLEVLKLQRVSPANLSYLLRPPHQLQWRQFQFTERWVELEQMKDVDTTLMASLPLVYFNYSLSGSNVEFLHRLPNLTVLDICCFHSTIGDHPDITAAALSSCRSLRRLRIAGHSRLTDVHLQTLLPCLSYLRSLSLEGAVLSSLSFLAQAPLTEQLTALCIAGAGFSDENYDDENDDDDEARRLPSSELRHVCELRHLVFLRLCCGCFSSQMESEFSLNDFQVPSQRMPQLQIFSTSPHLSSPLPQALYDAEDRFEYIT